MDTPTWNKMEKLTVIKVGGAVVEDDVQLATLLQQFADVEGKKILVHGGGRRATKVAAALGLQTTMIGGRRVTDKDMLDVVTMVYGGLVNKTIVAKLQALGINAIGLTGADMNVITAHKRPPQQIPMADGTRQTVDFGFVGDVDSADGAMLSALIKQGLTPVVAPLTHDGAGQLLNTNADTIAQTTATSLAPYYDVTLVFAFEKKGVLSNPADEDSVIPVITPADYRRYVADGTIAGGMIPKIDNAFDSLKRGVRAVRITCAANLLGGTIVNGLP